MESFEMPLPENQDMSQGAQYAIIAFLKTFYAASENITKILRTMEE